MEPPRVREQQVNQVIGRIDRPLIGFDRETYSNVARPQNLDISDAYTTLINNSNIRVPQLSREELTEEEKDIILVMSQSRKSREESIVALRNNGGDVVNAIMELTLG